MAREESVCQGGTRFQEACYGKVLLGREMEKGQQDREQES